MGDGMSYIEQNGYFTFDGVKSSDYGVWINGGGTYNAPARRYKEYTVPGRNGSLTIDEGAFEEIDHTYEAFIKDAFSTNIEDFRNQLMARSGYVRLTDSYHTDEFYRAKYMRGLDVDVAPGGVAGKFDLKFSRDPRRFLVSGETAATVASGGSVTNPTLYASRPLIRVIGYGSLLVGSDTVTIANGFPYIDIDCDTQDCYYGTENANQLVTFQNNDFPTLSPGSTRISYTSTITSVRITPRWYRI